MFAQTELVSYSDWGIVGALLVCVAGFLAYIKHRDSEDRKERAEMAIGFRDAIKSMTDKIEKQGEESRGALSELTGSFTAELANQRALHREDVTQMRQAVHDVRNIVGTAANVVMQQQEKKA